ELLVALAILEGHFVANLQAVSVELAARIRDRDISAIKVDEVEGDIPEFPVVTILDQDLRPFQLDNGRLDRSVLIRLEVLDILPHPQRILDLPGSGGIFQTGVVSPSAT
ncbi:MAG: hypothetical protein KDJ70_21885, partial [Candidatus Competibacteraceae bacterium]|nr:hypothetical protein [Candidatus Competibacteraceae bacterium]